MGFVAPQGLDLRIPAAAEPVEPVAHRILQVIILVVLLGRVKHCRRRNHRGDLLSELLAGVGAGRFRLALLFFVKRVDGGGIAFAPVAELP